MGNWQSRCLACAIEIVFAHGSLGTVKKGENAALVNAGGGLAKLGLTPISGKLQQTGLESARGVKG